MRSIKKRRQRALKTNPPSTLARIKVGAGFFLLVGQVLPAIADDGNACGLREPATSYCLTDIGALLGSDYSFAVGINNRGEVVGDLGGRRSFHYRDGHVYPIEPLPGDDAVHVAGINDAGVIVGSSMKTDSASDPTPITVGAGETTAIPGLRNALPYAVNDAGQVVGAAQGTGAFLYAGGKLISIGGEGTVAYGLNGKGEVVGISADSHAFVHTSDGTRELGTLPGDAYSTANAINDRGQIVGASGRTGINDGQAFLYSSGSGLVPLGRLQEGDSYSVATAINACGHVAGFSGDAPDFYAASGLRAFLSVSGSMIDLSARIVGGSAMVVTAASAINDSGQIAGRGAKDGHLHAVLLSPARDKDDCGKTGR